MRVRFKNFLDKGDEAPDWAAAPIERKTCSTNARYYEASREKFLACVFGLPPATDFERR
jgi:hypothetical protein